jgi:hypothetical protein
MYWSNFFHLYQPAEQQPDILEAIVAQSYRPILEGIKKNKKIRLTLNVNGALLDLFHDNKYFDLIDMLRELGLENRVEFTSSAKYHALLPFLNSEEIHRQISINNETCKFYLGNAFKPRGLFPPEMAWKPELTEIIEDMGFKWVILDEIAFNGLTEQVDYKKIYKISDSNLRVFFRERRISNLIMSAVVRSSKSLTEAIAGDLKSDRYIITAMDGETFGHHRPGLEKTLFEIFDTPGFEWCTISDLENNIQDEKTIIPVTSTWASSSDDIEKGIQFLSWKDPENIIHEWQWELQALVLNQVYAMNSSSSAWDRIRKEMDLALASDHFWWASAKPWWSLEMIEYGAFKLLNTIRSIPKVDLEKVNQAHRLYENIVSTAFNWQRTGKIRTMMKEQNSITRIPFKDRTVTKGGKEEGVFLAFIEMMKKLEKNAAEDREYEKAILWRDAIYKLENKLDIYDSINAIDLLRTYISHEEVEKTIEKYKNKFQIIRGGQPEQRGS